jgi:large repetitive protein
VIRATDGRQGESLQRLVVVVEPAGVTNQAPQITSTPLPLAGIGAVYAYEITATDADGGTLSYALLPNAPAGMTLSGRVINWTPTIAQSGSQSFQIQVSDGQGGVAIQSVPVFVTDRVGDIDLDAATIAVSGGNQAPVITSRPRTATGVGTPYFYEIQANDPNGDALTYVLLPGAPAGMTLTGRVVQWNPTIGDLGNRPFQIEVRDGRGGITRQTVPLVVGNLVANRAPMITDSPQLQREVQQQDIFQSVITELDPKPQFATVGEIYAYNFKGVDLDGDIVAWSLLQAPVGMTIDGATGALRWQPNPNQLNGEGYEVVVALTDAYGASDTVKFKLITRGDNLPPLISSVPLTVIPVGRTYEYAVQANDPENSVLRYALGARPQGMNINAQTGLITWNPMTTQVGNHEVEVIVIPIRLLNCNSEMRKVGH